MSACSTLRTITRLNWIALAGIVGGWLGFGEALACFGLADRLDGLAPKPPLPVPAPAPSPPLSGPDWLREALDHKHWHLRAAAIILVKAKTAELESWHALRWVHWRAARGLLRLAFKPRRSRSPA
jgi:hypothetical protein